MSPAAVARNITLIDAVRSGQAGMNPVSHSPIQLDKSPIMTTLITTIWLIVALGISPVVLAAMRRLAVHRVRLSPVGWLFVCLGTGPFAIAAKPLTHARAVDRKLQCLKCGARNGAIAGKGQIHRFLRIDPARFADIEAHSRQCIARGINRPLPKSVMRD